MKKAFLVILIFLLTACGSGGEDARRIWRAVDPTAATQACVAAMVDGAAAGGPVAAPLLSFCEGVVASCMLAAKTDQDLPSICGGEILEKIEGLVPQ